MLLYAEMLNQLPSDTWKLLLCENEAADAGSAEKCTQWRGLVSEGSPGLPGLKR